MSEIWLEEISTPNLEKYMKLYKLVLIFLFRMCIEADSQRQGEKKNYDFV